MTIFISAMQQTWEDVPTFYAFSFKPTGDYVPVCEKEIEFSIPDNFSMQAGKIELLLAEKEAATVKFHKTLAEINDRINSLQCLEMTP